MVPPLSCDPHGIALNTNADDIALAVAQGMNAEKLVFCSNIPGVCRDPADPSTRISSLTPSRVRQLVDEGDSGRHDTKLESCLAALEAWRTQNSYHRCRGTAQSFIGDFHNRRSGHRIRG